MAVANTYPPPAGPYQAHQQAPPQPAPQLHSTQQKPAEKPRKSRTFSFKSDKSRGSGSNHKIDLHETSAEKKAKRLHSKADPTLAMQEAEPSEVAATGKSFLAPLRSIQHRDPLGNPITEPDRSNPTRSRWERPLDTIRSFEAAIDGGYSNRRSVIRPETTDGSTWGNRRSSYYGNGNGGRPPHDSYSGSRPPSMMYGNRADASLPDLRASGTGNRDSYYDQQSGYGGYGQTTQNGRRGWPRMASEPQYGGSSHRQQHNAQDHPVPSNHRSHETVTTASGGGSSAEPAGYQTDPTSSDNSSIERGQSVPRRQAEPVNDYGIGFSQSPSYQPPNFAVGVQNSGTSSGGNNYQTSGGNSYQTEGAYSYGQPAPPVPHKDQSPVLRKPTAASHTQQARAAQPEKRKSWLARRFSKNA